MRSGVAIIGCGGVGSNLAYMLTRGDEKPEKMILIDHDTINEGNLSRQMFSVDDVGENKAEALGAMLKQMNPDVEFEAYNQKIESEADLGILTDVAYVFVCTDNMESKRLINKAKKDGVFNGITFFVGCEETYFEVKSTLDKEDLATWSLESGYNSTQAARSNMSSAFYMYHLWCNMQETVNSVVQLHDFDRIGSRDVTLNTKTVQLTENKKEFLLHNCDLRARGKEGKTKQFMFQSNALKISVYNEAEGVKFMKEIFAGGISLFTEPSEGTNRITSQSELESIIEKRATRTRRGSRT